MSNRSRHTRHCRSCGISLEDQPKHYHTCSSCYWKDPPSVPDHEGQIAALREQVRAQGDEIRFLQAELTRAKLKPAGLVLTGKQVKLLLTRCHPDQWQHPMADEITRNLLSLR